MEPPIGSQLERTASLTLPNSRSSSRKSQTARARIRKHDSNTSLQPGGIPSDQGFTSFPSLSPSPDPSPLARRSNADERGGPDNGGRTMTIDTSAADTGIVRKVSKAAQSLVGSLTESSPVDTNRTALFDDAPRDTRTVPGSLHYAPDVHIQHMIDQTGAITLIKQLAGDLASRDAQVTALRIRAEERERVLRKMLAECGVSNLDIENRLRTLEKAQEAEENRKANQGARSTSILSDTYMHDTIDKRLQNAMQEEMDYSSLATTGTGAERSSDALSGSTPASRETKVWKSYLWNDTSKRGSRSSSLMSNQGDGTDHNTPKKDNSAGSRPGLRSDLFVPPEPTSGAVPNLRRLQSQEPVKNRRTSGGMASWALKLVGGGGGDKAGTVRGKSNGAKKEPEQSTGGSKTLPRGAVGPVTRGRTGRTSLGPHGTVKGISPENMRNNLGTTSPHAGRRRSPSNAGPVEMDTILPEDTRPPTLAQLHSYAGSHEYLIDRFGFIYDQRRKKRQSEAAAALKKQKRASNVESLGDARTKLHDISDNEQSPPASNKLSRVASRPGSTHSSVEETQPGKRWQDFLKLATIPTELLSHTPSTAPITTVESSEIEATTKAPQASMQNLRTASATRANAITSPSRVQSGNAEFATPVASAEPTSPTTVTIAQPSASDLDPVKALLEQLTDLHDTTQREKTVKWNEFLRKVRAERKREGESTAATDGRANAPEAQLIDGEVIGIAGLGNKGNIGRAKWKEFHDLVLGGIPVAYRAKTWAECCGATTLRIPGYYEDLLANGTDDPAILSQIEMDITRTLTDNIFFRRGPGVQKLKEVLVAYSRRNTTVGYCQGMNLITASLLLILPSAEDAFWVLASMIENILPENYYDHSLLTSRADQVVLRSYVAELLPTLSAHLDELSIELEALTFQWFLSIFTDCLTAEALYRVWDVVLCMHDGSTFLFQVALALLKLNEKQLLDCDNPAAVYHYINHQMTNHAISIDGLMLASEALKKVVRRKEVEERRARAVERERGVMLEREELRRQRALVNGRKSKSPAPSDATSLTNGITATTSTNLLASTIATSTSTSPPPSTAAPAAKPPPATTSSSPSPLSITSPPSVPSITPTPTPSAPSSRIITPLFSPLRSASSVASFQIDADAFAEQLEGTRQLDMEVRTPMPIDEEAEWRG